MNAYLDQLEEMKIDNNFGTFVDLGSECIVYQNSEYSVVKRYETPKKACRAYGRSKRAAKYGVGPQVWGLDIGRCCFQQEYVKIVNTCDIPYENERHALYQKMVKLHFCNKGGGGELHSGNIGWTAKGKLVCVDFGDLSSYIMK